MTLDPRAIAELERLLADSGTDEDWQSSWEFDMGGWQAVGPFRHPECGDEDPVGQAESDAQLIATMRNLLPDLLRERRELLTKVADLHSRIAGDMLALGNDELAEQHEALAAEWRVKATEGT